MDINLLDSGGEEFAELDRFLDRLVKSRNKAFPEFNVNLEGKNAEVYMPGMGELLELERLKMQEQSLTADLNEITTNINMVKDITKAEVGKKVKLKGDLLRKTEQNKKTLVELRTQKRHLRDQERNLVLMTKDISDRMNYPKFILETFLKVSPGGFCEDKEFCQIFSGGKCSNNCTQQQTGKDKL